MVDECVVGHVPLNLAKFYLKFLQFSNSSVPCQVVGKRVNSRAEYGLGIPVNYIFYGHLKAMEWMEKLLRAMLILQIVWKINI